MRNYVWKIYKKTKFHRHCNLQGLIWTVYVVFLYFVMFYFKILWAKETRQKRGILITMKYLKFHLFDLFCLLVNFVYVRSASKHMHYRMHKMSITLHITEAFGRKTSIESIKYRNIAKMKVVKLFCCEKKCFNKAVIVFFLY